MRTLPEYVKSGVMYQLFLRPFTPEGTFKAAEAMLPHLASLGVDIIYLCPFFAADTDEDIAGWSDRQRGSNLGQPKNPYRIADYFHVDEEYGTDEDCVNFVAAAHALGMRVIFDLVYFHCGPTAVFLAEHKDFVMLDEDGKIAVGEWRFPRLNFENRELRDYLISNMKALIDGATIENGTAKDGGNLYVYSGSDLTVKNATITGGKASNLGGHVVVAQNSKLTMIGTDLAGGTANNSGNIYIGGGCTVNLSNMTVSGAVSKTNVGGIFVGSKTKLTLDHVTLSGNTATGNTTTGSTATGNTTTGNTASSNSGNTSAPTVSAPAATQTNILVQFVSWILGLFGF
jgi:hypothetical protein